MLSSKRSKFSLPKKVTYLNCAYMSPLMKVVEKAGLRGMRLKRNPADITPETFYKDRAVLRERFAKLINVANSERIAITVSASYGLANVARNLNIKKTQHIIVAAGQFPSNYYPWQTLCDETGAQMKIVEPPPGLENRGKLWNERILEAIDDKTRAVAIANTHWADGTKFDLEAIRKRTREVGGLLIVDGTQSVGALSFDVSRVQPDALVCAGYKWLLGPYSTGVAYYGEYFDSGKPFEQSWINRLKSEDFSALVNYESSYQPGAIRFDVGEPSNFILLPMLIKSIEQINKWGVNNIQEYCQSLSEPAIAKLREKGYWIEDLAFRAGHLFGVRLPNGISVEKVKHGLLRENVYVSFRGDAIRVSPNVYNTRQDLDKLVRILTRI